MLSEDSRQKTRGRRPGPLKRISAADATAVREVLAVAWQVFEPEEQTQRQLFAALLPDLYVLRNKGYSFRQLAALLNRCGLDLQPGTVRTYYGEMIATKMEICEQRLNEQMLLLNEVQKLTRSAETPKLASRIAALREQQMRHVDDRVTRVLDLPPPRDHIEGANVRRQEIPAATISTAPPPSPPPSAPSDTVEDSGGEFGLLGKGASTVAIKPGGGFFGMDVDDQPQIPELSRSAPAAAPSPSTSDDESAQQRRSSKQPMPGHDASELRCTPLQPGVPPLSRRPGVPSEVYEDRSLEHPAIPGLMLSLEERLYGAALEILNTQTGEVLQETLDQKRFRIKWATPLVPGGSQAGFTPLHADTLPNR